MSAMVSQITGVLIVYSTVCSGADQRNHQSSVSLAFVRGIYRWPVNSPHKGPVTRKNFHLMTSSWDWLDTVMKKESWRGLIFKRLRFIVVANCEKVTNQLHCVTMRLTFTSKLERVLHVFTLLKTKLVKIKKRPIAQKARFSLKKRVCKNTYLMLRLWLLVLFLIL